MKILQVHNLYRQPGGEDVVAEQEADLLGDRNKVDRWIRDNTTELKSLWQRLVLPFTTHHSSRSGKAMRKRLRKGEYDLMHVHNFFPLFSPAIFDAARELGVPSVLTLHNYRLIHPNGLLFHEGKIDERSVKGSAWACVRDGIYRGSVLQTAVVAHMIEYHRKQGTWNRIPSLFIALTEFAKAKLAEGGIPKERIFVKPNFVPDPGPEVFSRRLNWLQEQAKRSGTSPSVTDSSSGTGRDYFIFAGRISPEKGVRDLIETWNRHELEAELRIAGDGPEKEELIALSVGNPRIQWLGRLNREDVRRQMERARAFLLPSHCYEGFPMTLAEAFSVGCPAIVTNIGSQAEIVQTGRNGLHVPVSDHKALAEAVKRLAGLVETLSSGARKRYLESYTPEVNYERLMEIYDKAKALERDLRRGRTGG